MHVVAHCLFESLVNMHFICHLLCSNGKCQVLKVGFKLWATSNNCFSLRWLYIADILLTWTVQTCLRWDQFTLGPCWSAYFYKNWHILFLRSCFGCLHLFMWSIVPWCEWYIGHYKPSSTGWVIEMQCTWLTICYHGKVLFNNGQIKAKPCRNIQSNFTY